MPCVATTIELFRALADPTRLRIVALLRRMELSVGELAVVLEQSQPRVSRHIRILVDAGLADRRREGSWVFLTPAPIVIDGALATVIESGEGTDVAADAARLVAVRADRAVAAARYFAEHAEQWDAIRSLHASDDAVEARMRALLGGDVERLVDLGTGTGRMLELFGSAAKRAVGVDRSPEMLRLARAKLADRGPSVDLRQGDANALPLGDATADTVIIHQVLHYLPAPEAAIVEAARILSASGRVLIVDFASHDHEELRTQDAHARLGFSDEQMRAWFGGAGLELVHTEALAGAKLTVKLWLGIRPPLAKAHAA